MIAFAKFACAAAALLALTTPLAGQTPPPPVPGKTGSHLRFDDYRVAEAGYRLAVAGKPLCRAPHPVTGMILHYLPEYEGANRVEAASRYGVARGPGVLAVVKGSPAMRAGLMAGDVLLAVNEVRMPSGTELARRAVGKKWRKILEPLEDSIEGELRRGATRLRVWRAGKQLDLVIEPVPGCPIRSRLARSNQANAFSDGRTAILTTRLLRFTQNEDELALVLAHEAAHNILGHEERIEQENIPKGLLANLGKSGKRLRQFEADADRLALRLLWAAGYNVGAAIPFWRRLYHTFEPIGVPTFMSAHPRLAARERIAAETIAELSAAR